MITGTTHASAGRAIPGMTWTPSQPVAETE
jgi:hypothetical protein